MKLEVKNASFSYKQKEILKNISFQLDSSEVLAILGPNGIGKTSLLKCLMGLLDWKSGASYLDGRDIKTIPSKEFWSNVSYVPQAKSLTFDLNALDMVVLGMVSKKSSFAMPQKEDFERARECLARIGVEHLADKSCASMSGGEFQMVLIARALINNPTVLILDEPETGLDFKNQLSVLTTINKLAVEDGMSVILNTHYPTHALQIADKSLMLLGLNHYRFGDTKEVIEPELMKKAYQVEVLMDEVCHQNESFHYIIPTSCC